MTGRRREREADEMRKFLGRMMRAMVVRAAAGDLDALVALRQIRGDVDEAVVDAARALHEFRQPYSWTEIGDALGISRQAARQQFADNRALSGNCDRRARG